MQRSAGTNKPGRQHQEVAKVTEPQSPQGPEPTVPDGDNPETAPSMPEPAGDRPGRNQR